MLIASRLIRRNVELGHLNRPVVVIVVHAFIGYVPVPTTAAARAGGVANCSRPDFDSSLTSQLLPPVRGTW